MPGSARRELMPVVAMVFLANAVDLASTYAVSPDLANEWNILQRQFGLGWAGIIIAKLIGSLLAVAGYAYYLRYREACYPGPGADRSTFARHFSFGRQASWIEMQRGIPLGRHLGVNLGYFWSGMQLLVFWVAVDNLLLRQGIVFPLRHYSEMAYHLMQSAIVAGLILTHFYRSNYRHYVLMTDGRPYDTLGQSAAPAVQGADRA